MIVEKQMECRLAGETEVLGENLPQRHFKPATTRLSYGAATIPVFKRGHCDRLFFIMMNSNAVPKNIPTLF
jgi:hypothetical protein